MQHHEYLLWLADRLSTPTPAHENQGQLAEITADIANREVDAIVNAWNRNIVPSWLLLPQGVSRSLRKAGGQSSIRSVGRSGPLPLGGAVETEAGTLPAKWIIHADAINMAWRASEQSIRKATQASLRLAHWLGARTVALPILGAGSGGFSSTMALAAIREEAEAFRHRFDRIELIRFSRDSRPSQPPNQHDGS